MHRQSTTTLADIMDGGRTVERLATGFVFTEGPIWYPDGSLHFSDIPGDTRYRWHESDGVSIVRSPSDKTNGSTLDRDGHLITCEQTTSHVVRTDAAGRREIIASHYDGKELNSPNDVVAASDGSIWFTDPDWGRTYPGFGLERPVELSFKGVFRAPDGGGELELVADDFDGPNGLCFSPDETRLYVNDSPRCHIRVFNIAADGRVTGGGVFASGIGDGAFGSGVVDGMKADEHGNIYVTGPRGIWIFSPYGARVGIIEVPEEAANLNWGGPDWKTLYITATASIYRIRLAVAGAPCAYMRRSA
jgi:gluconolactonase